jgi:hypothetical protein
MNTVMTAPCRSYSSQEFDGCPACVDAALDAVTQAGMYILGQAAPTLASRLPGSDPLEMDYVLKVTLFDTDDREIATDEIEVDQEISAVAAADEMDDRGADHEADGEADQAADGEADESGDEGPQGSMRLDDFQTLIDLVDLAPAGSAGARGAITGRIFGFERPIGRFEIEVGRSH